MPVNISSSLSSLIKAAEQSSVLSDLLVSATPDTYPKISRLKIASDATTVSLFKKLGMDAASSIAASKLEDILATVGKGTAIGTGIAVPLYIAGRALLNNAAQKAEDTRRNLTENAPNLVASIITAGKGAFSSKTSSLIQDILPAMSLNSKLSVAAENGLKTAGHAEYRMDVLHRSNAHIAHMVNELLLQRR